MSFPARWKAHAADTGNFDSDAAGTTNAGTAISTAGIAAGTLSCLFIVEAETNTITISGKFQVSNDGSTWYDVLPLNGAALVALATGTAGDDAVVSVVLDAPESVLGWKEVRAAVVNGVTTGATTDTYSMALHYRAFNGFS